VKRMVLRIYGRSYTTVSCC